MAADVGADNKFVAKELLLGSAKTAANGLSTLLGLRQEELSTLMARGVDAIREEFDRNGTDDDRECLDYVLNQEAGASCKKFVNSSYPRDHDEHGLRADRRRREDGKPMRLADFVNHPHAKEAGLDVAHVVALRLYTTWAFRSINNPLREASTKRPRHPLPCTVAFLEDGIKKMRALHEISGTSPMDLWRGLKNLHMATNFEQDGGTEVGWLPV